MRMIVDKQAWIKKSRLGGLRRNQTYGNPGTAEGRSTGGKRSIRFFHANPEYAKKVGFVIRKEINYPPKSQELAEFFGIFLGDGGIRGMYQLAISFDYYKDADYAVYVGNMIWRLFSIGHTVCKRKNNNAADIVVSSSHLIEFLREHGIKGGNKVANQIEVPGWIQKRLDFSSACLRGLVDTDGGLYWHRYESGGKNYRYLKLCFTNHSQPILQFAWQTMKMLKLRAYISKHHVSIYSRSGLKEYFLRVKSNNPKHISKWNSYSS